MKFKETKWKMELRQVKIKKRYNSDSRWTKRFQRKYMSASKDTDFIN